MTIRQYPKVRKPEMRQRIRADLRLILCVSKK